MSGSYAGHQEHVSPMARSDSTPVLTFTERELMQSPQLNRKSNNSNIDKQQQQQQQMEEDAKAESAKKNNFLQVEDEEDGHPKLRRASSLKSGKTPPGTPSRHKIVR